MTDPLSTQRLGRYRILRKLGKGGMSTVYHAVQEGPHGFENEVAVKLIDPELLADYPHLRKALVDEARIAARIRHPNVVRILDLVDEGDKLYMVMDFVDGVSLRQVLDAARKTGINPPIGPLLEVLAAAADGLHAAHQLVGTDGASLELVHRDVKPGNILIGADGQVKVSDFGIAMFDDRAAEATAQGQMKGTPAYMAPEQVMGEAVDWRADVFSLGLTLYTMATSRLVFYGETALAIAMKIATHPLDDHAEALDALAPGLGDVFERMTTRKPEDRYGTAQEAGNALRVVHAHLETSHSVSELLASAGWRRWVRTEPPPPPVEPQPTPGLAGVPRDDEEQPTAIDEPVAIAREPDLLLPVEDQPTVDGPGEDEPTDAGPGPAVGLDTDRNEQSTAEGPAPIPSTAFDAEATPPAPPPPMASTFAPPPGAPPPPGPPPGGMVLDARAEVVESRPTPPPAAQSTAAMDRSQYQPVRDYRGRVVRKKRVDPDAARVSRTERLGVAVAFLLMVAAVFAIVWVQVKNPPPVDKDPRIVADAEAMVGADEAGAAPAPKPEATPDAVAAVAGRSILDRQTGDAAKPARETKPTPKPEATAAPEPKAQPKATPKPKVSSGTPKPKAAPKATPKPKVAVAEPEPEPAEADPGSLTINTYPWSNVTVDGVARGRTPVRSLAMPPGKHTVRLVFPTLDDKVVTKSVTVTSGQDTRLMERLDAKAADAP